MATSPFVTGGGAIPQRQTTAPSPFVTGGGYTPGRGPIPAQTPAPVANTVNPLPSEAQRLANNQAQLAARQAARTTARANSGGNYFTVSDAPNNTVSAPMQELNRLSQNSVMGYDPNAFKSWQAANPNGLNLSDPRYAGIDQKQLSQFVARNPQLMGPGAATYAPDRSGFVTSGGTVRPAAPAGTITSDVVAGGTPGFDMTGGLGRGVGLAAQRDNSAAALTGNTPAMVDALRQKPNRFEGFGMGPNAQGPQVNSTMPVNSLGFKKPNGLFSMR